MWSRDLNSAYRIVVDQSGHDIPTDADSHDVLIHSFGTALHCVLHYLAQLRDFIASAAYAQLTDSLICENRI